MAYYVDNRKGDNSNSLGRLLLRNDAQVVTISYFFCICHLVFIYLHVIPSCCLFRVLMFCVVSNLKLKYGNQMVHDGKNRT